jgi:hypothetical protein
MSGTTYRRRAEFLSPFGNEALFKKTTGQGLGWRCLFAAMSYLFHRFSLAFSSVFLLTSYHWTFLSIEPLI